MDRVLALCVTAGAGMPHPPAPPPSRPMRRLIERLGRRLIRHSSRRERALLLAPPLVLASMEVAFRALAAAFGPKVG